VIEIGGYFRRQNRFVKTIVMKLNKKELDYLQDYVIEKYEQVPGGTWSSHTGARVYYMQLCGKLGIKVSLMRTFTKGIPQKEPIFSDEEMGFFKSKIESDIIFKKGDKKMLEGLLDKFNKNWVI
jgi:hypothetical protein